MTWPLNKWDRLYFRANGIGACLAADWPGLHGVAAEQLFFTFEYNLSSDCGVGASMIGVIMCMLLLLLAFTML